MIAPRLPENLATIRQIGTPQFQIAGIAHRTESHVRRRIVHVDHSNYRTPVIYDLDMTNGRHMGNEINAQTLRASTVST
jgi:hypothetical protein